ncbi:MAG: flagellar hook-associated protein 3 FlgL [Fusobacteriaceae bacterium]|jgi:flagellar hook-associated protein 3 FlgL|nr:flagellar hook-associated protein 3 [Fusobacteriales bacterium]MDN5304246.1 flagellar hook-associated protein 3 FlgL [Fusobacteriaceae bacterium]
MRVTGKMMTTNAISNIQNNMEKMDITNDRLSKGTKINLPQDNPIGAVKVMSYQTALTEIEKYLENVDNAKTYLNSTDVSLTQVSEILQRIRELSVQAANDSFEQTARDAVASEINELIEQLVVVGNSSIGGRYIFAGYNTQEKPFKIFTGEDLLKEGEEANLDLIDVEGNTRKDILKDVPVRIDYTGDQGVMMTEVDKGVTLEYNVTGDKIFKNKDGDLFEELLYLRDSIYKGDVNKDTDNDGHTIESQIGELDRIFNMIMKYRSQVGAKMRRVEQVEARLEDNKISMSDLLSRTQDTDITKSIMDLKTQENVQRMSLSVGAKVIQPTLVDFVK